MLLIPFKTQTYLVEHVQINKVSATHALYKTAAQSDDFLLAPHRRSQSFAEQLSNRGDDF
jgi:hypothetical protein